MIRVFVVDDHQLIREGLRKVLKADHDIKIVGEAQSSEELLATIAKVNADIIILDVSLPGRSGLECISELRRLKPQARVLVLSMYPEKRYAIRALKAGAMGYITKQSISDEVLKAIRRIAEGGRYITTFLAEELADEVQSMSTGDPERSLSDREFDVLRRIASGKSVGTIADELSLSVFTVTTYRSRLLKKLRMKTNAELIRFALEKRLIE